MAEQTFDLDLDTLVKPSKKVKLNGSIIELEPPSLEELVKLAKLGGELQGMDTSNLNADEVSNVIDKLNEGIRDVMPALKDVKLNIEQIIAVIEMMVDYATPNDTKELEKHGVKLDGDQKKTPSV
jgi:hypothetical protein